MEDTGLDIGSAKYGWLRFEESDGYLSVDTRNSFHYLKILLTRFDESELLAYLTARRESRMAAESRDYFKDFQVRNQIVAQTVTANDDDLATFTFGTPAHIGEAR